MKKTLKILSIIFASYLLYALFAGVIIFSFHTPNVTEYHEEHPVQHFYGEKESSDRVALVEERLESGIARIDLINRAEETLDITYHTIHDGFSTDIFLGAIIDAADRGVQVRVLLDGLFHNLRGSLRGVQYAFDQHPNIEISMYEPLSITKPWTWNNRLHDKMMIIDNEYGIIGGRNIGDKYFQPEYDGATHDRDVVIINTATDNEPITKTTSAVHEMTDYFNYVWNHKFTHDAVRYTNYIRNKRGDNTLDALRYSYADIQTNYPQLFNHDIPWEEISFSTNNVTLIHNPIERMNKEPLVWLKIVSLMEAAEKDIFIQSPYVIPTDEMLSYLDKSKITADNTTIFTNSLASTPNVIAFSGYTNVKQDVVAFAEKIYEYQGPDSVHAKTYIFDQRISVIGSFNLDARSAFLSTETMVVIDSEEFTNELLSVISSSYYTNSLIPANESSYRPNDTIEDQPVSFWKKNVVRLLSYITRHLDYML
ncbi:MULTISPECIES: phospholipase D-like domain-containing protein [Bacillaceae]|uniref:Phospholipase D family protein n=1 Tax=Evansella alkalicola TaxID=745819 RepID=A0ABS6JNL8_9BACI|nr:MULTISPECIES: phospholipase D family protein [Bacillaceae]MBU9720154.1 phospholipase D family protein [Bacillus alkalicola]